MTGRLGVLRAPAVAVYLFTITANVNLTGFYATLPTFRDDLGLSELAGSAIATSSGLAMIPLALPMGLISDRFGARRVTTVCIALVLLSGLGSALAVDAWTLLAARILFGVGFTGMLTAAIAWLSASLSLRQRARAIGGIMPAAGVGGLIGPYLAGGLVDASGLRAAFLAVTALSGINLLLAITSHPGGQPPPHEPVPARALVAALRVPVIAAGCALVLIGVITDTVLSIIVPQQLDDNGLSAGAIGAIFSLSGGVYIVATLVAVRWADRLVTLRRAGISSFAVACVLIPVAISNETWAQASTMVLRGLVIGVAFVICFPLATLGASAVGLALGAASGVVMLASGTANGVAPLGGRAVAELVGNRWTYAILGVSAIAAGLWMVRASRGGAGEVLAQRHEEPAAVEAAVEARP